MLNIKVHSWKQRYNREVWNMVFCAEQTNKKADVYVEKFANAEDFQKAFDDCQERLRYNYGR
jgi:hypothetical protein